MSISGTTMQELDNKLWNTLNHLRGQLSVEEYCPIIGLFFVLKKKHLLHKITVVNPHEYKTAIRSAFDKLRNEEDLFHVYLSLERSIENISTEALHELANSIDAIGDLEFAEFGKELFDRLIFRVAKISGRKGAEFIQPAELSNLIKSIAKLKPGATVYNPFAGLASFALIDDNIEYVGQEIYAQTWALAQLRLLIHGKGDNCVLLNQDSIQRWNPLGGKYDLIVANPPFNMRINDEFVPLLGDVRTVDPFLIAKAIDDLMSNGKVISVHTNGFLFREGTEKRLRKHLIENDLLEMVISLPGGLFSSTSIPASLVVINKNKTRKGFVRFVDAGNLLIGKSGVNSVLDIASVDKLLLQSEDTKLSAFIANKTIAESDYNLSPKRFLKVDTRQNLVKLQDVLQPYKQFRSKGGFDGSYVRTRDLKDSNISFQLIGNDLELCEVPKGSYEVKDSVLLLATRWNTLKPTYFQYQGASIFVSADIAAFTVDENKVDVGYLISELHTDHVRDAISNFSVGSVISTIRKDDLLEIGIEILPLEEQRAKVRGITEAYFSEKRRELELEAKIHGLQGELYEQNAFLKHSLAGPTSNLSGSTTKIKKILEEKVLPLFPELLELKDTPGSRLTLGSYLNILTRDIQRVNEIVASRTKATEMIKDTTLRNVDIIAWIRRYFGELQAHKGYTVECDIDEETLEDVDTGKTILPEILASNELLYRMMDNLVANAEKHAFPGNEGNMLSVLAGINPPKTPGGKKEFFIMVSNTGTGFPEGYTIDDYSRKGSKGTNQEGDGYGGWLINEIVQKMGGQMEIWSPGITEFSSTINFTFPIIELDGHEAI